MGVWRDNVKSLSIYLSIHLCHNYLNFLTPCLSVPTLCLQLSFSFYMLCFCLAAVPTYLFDYTYMMAAVLHVSIYPSSLSIFLSWLPCHDYHLQLSTLTRPPSSSHPKSPQTELPLSKLHLQRVSPIFSFLNLCYSFGWLPCQTIGLIIYHGRRAIAMCLSVPTLLNYP